MFKIIYFLMKGEKTLMIIFKILYNKEGNILIDDSIQKLTKKEVLHLKKDILISILDSFQLDRSNYTSNNNQSFTVKIKIGREIKYSTCKVEFIDYNEEYLSFIIYHPRDVNIQYHVKIVNDCLLQFFKILDNLHSIQDEKNKYKAIISNNKVEKDLNKAFYWNKKSAEQGNINAQYNMACMYYYGEGVDQNLDEAFKWFKEAAEKGHIESQYNLADMYYNGEGVEQDLNEAFKWFKKVAEQGDEEAQFRLGVMYYNGEGTEENKEEAFKLIEKAADALFEDAIEFLQGHAN